VEGELVVLLAVVGMAAARKSARLGERLNRPAAADSAVGNKQTIKIWMKEDENIIKSTGRGSPDTDFAGNPVPAAYRRGLRPDFQLNNPMASKIYEINKDIRMY
jgi:hypothetical protein